MEYHIEEIVKDIQISDLKNWINDSDIKFKKIYFPHNTYIFHKISKKPKKNVIIQILDYFHIMKSN